MLSFEKNLYSLKKIQIFADKMGWAMNYITAKEKVVYVADLFMSWVKFYYFDVINIIL